jgi:hypothetical protein
MRHNEAMAKGRDRRKRAAKRKNAAVVREAEGPRPSNHPLKRAEDPPAVDPMAPVRAPLRPRPHLSFGAVALPQPESMEEDAALVSIRSRGR